MSWADDRSDAEDLANEEGPPTFCPECEKRGEIRAEIARETGRGGTETLSGDEARWRRDYLVSQGWSCQDFGRFKPPEAWSAISKVQAADRRARAKRKARAAV